MTTIYMTSESSNLTRISRLTSDHELSGLEAPGNEKERREDREKLDAQRVIPF